MTEVGASVAVAGLLADARVVKERPALLDLVFLVAGQSPRALSYESAGPPYGEVRQMKPER